MRLTDCPQDVLTIILSKVPTRCLCVAATTCTALRAAARHVPSLRPLRTPTNAQALARWLDTDHVRDRVTTVRVTRSRAATQPPLLLKNLQALRTLTVAFSRVHPQLFSNAPTSLQHLFVHALRPGASDTFSTRCLRDLVNLRLLHITFAPGWLTALVQADLAALTALEYLELRRIPIIRVAAPIHATRAVVLHAFDALYATPTAPPAPASLASAAPPLLDLRCDAHDHGMVDVARWITPTSAPALRSLRLSMPWRLDIPCFESMRNLEMLALHFRTFHVPDMARVMPRLQHASLAVDGHFVIDDRSSIPHGTDLRATSSGGVPMDLRRWCFPPGRDRDVLRDPY